MNDSLYNCQFLHHINIFSITRRRIRTFYMFLLIYDPLVWCFYWYLCSSHHKRQQGKKPPSERIPTSAKLQQNSDKESEPENSVPNSVDTEHIVNHETTFKDDVDSRVDVEHIDEQKNLGALSASAIETNRDVKHTDEQILDNLTLPAVTKALVLSFINKPVVNLDADCVVWFCFLFSV